MFKLERFLVPMLMMVGLLCGGISFGQTIIHDHTFDSNYDNGNVIYEIHQDANGNSSGYVTLNTDVVIENGATVIVYDSNILVSGPRVNIPATDRLPSGSYYFSCDYKHRTITVRTGGKLIFGRYDHPEDIPVNYCCEAAIPFAWPSVSIVIEDDASAGCQFYKLNASSKDNCIELRKYLNTTINECRLQGGGVMYKVHGSE